MNLSNVIGLGVAGNFTGHLEQAGEAKDFDRVEVVEEQAPKGIFPYYVPNSKNFLGTDPVSSSEIRMIEGGVNLQPEPEVALLCELTYKNKRVIKLIPKQFTAFNDCSIRRDARKISEKKNWGPSSQGASDTFIPIDNLETGGVMDNYNITCFLKRDEEVHVYGVDSPISGYTYFYGQLIDWIIDRLNNQKDEGPLENIAELLAVSGFPKQALITIGATRYTSFGEKTYLKKDDELFVVIYDSGMYEKDTIEKLIGGSSFPTKNISVLKQKVVTELTRLKKHPF